MLQGSLTIQWASSVGLTQGWGIEVSGPVYGVAQTVGMFAIAAYEGESAGDQAQWGAPLPNTSTAIELVWTD